MGYPNNNIDTSTAMLYYMDAVVGLVSILHDTDAERRKLYGKAGCFRLQKYGFEYRTLSSYWIASEDRLRYIWRQVEYALWKYERNDSIPDPSMTQGAINNNDIETAKLLIERYDLISPKNKE